MGSPSSADDVLHGARGDLDVDAGLVGVDVLDGLLDQVLHHRGGGHRDDSRRRSRPPSGLAAGAAHREEADEADDEQRARVRRSTNVLAERPAPPEPSAAAGAVSGAVESSRLMWSSHKEYRSRVWARLVSSLYPPWPNDEMSSATNAALPRWSSWPDPAAPGSPGSRSGSGCPSCGSTTSTRTATTPPAPHHHGANAGLVDWDDPDSWHEDDALAALRRAVRHRAQRGARLRDRPERPVRLAHGRPRRQHPVRRGGHLRAGGRRRVPRGGPARGGVLHHPAPARHVLAAAHPRPARAPQAAAGAASAAGWR